MVFLDFGDLLKSHFEVLDFDNKKEFGNYKICIMKTKW